MTEGETITAIGASADQRRRAKESFAAFLEDGEILRTVRPMFEPADFEDDLSDVVITRSAPIQGAVRSEGSLVPQSEVQSPSNFPLSRLLSYLGAEEGNDIDAVQKLVDTGINISPQGFRNWASGGVSSEYVEHLVNRGTIPSAAAVFGPEVGNFDSMLTYGDFYERLLAFADANGIKKSSIGKLAGKTSTRDVENQVNSWKKRKAEAKTVTGKTLSGTKTKISDSEIDSIIKKINDLNKANGKPEITREDVINPKNRGLSSGKRVVNVTPSEARKQTARMNIKYPNLSKAYNSVSDIPTPERLNGRALSSGRRQEIYDTLTKTVIDQMEKARATGSKWSFPWHKGRMAPRNSSTSSRYRGINHIMLSIAQEEAGYEKPVWGTFKQWQAMGGNVKKGEKGTPIIFWSRVEYDDKDNPGEKKTKAILKESYVFNLDQVEGIDRSKFDEPETLSEDLRRTDIDDIRSALGIDLTHAGDRAYFSPNDDKIVMPPFGEFKTPEGYYGTLLHEITHWTGHRDRLNRDNMHQYKSEPDYAFEELIAELGTAYLMSMLDVTVEPREDHAQYLAFWIQKLQNDPDALMRAATLAQKAADYIIENVPALREAQEKADRIADEARAEAKKRAEDVASARPKTGGRSSTTRRPNTRKRK
jgi:antirestriction protein ArdC